MTRLLLQALAMFVFCVSSSAALANCADYGSTAVAQQNENISLGCGFSGLRWHSDAASHTGFCRLVGEGTISGETAIREAELAKCRPAEVVEPAEAMEPAEVMEPAETVENDSVQPSQCERSEIAEGKGVNNGSARSAAHSLLGRPRAEMMNAGLTQCMYHDLGCTGANSERTCFLSVECCAK